VIGLRGLRTRVRRLERPACRFSAEDCPAHETTLILGPDDPEPAEADIPLCRTCLNPGLCVVFEVVVVGGDQEARSSASVSMR
jgi:hypothetical protein